VFAQQLLGAQLLFTQVAVMSRASWSAASRPCPSRNTTVTSSNVSAAPASRTVRTSPWLSVASNCGVERVWKSSVRPPRVSVVSASKSAGGVPVWKWKSGS